MKKILLLLLIATATILHAQRQPGEDAILPQCKSEANPNSCTHDKLTEDIIKFITPEITAAQIKDSRKHFTLSLIFIVDGNGNVIPGETRALCEVEAVKDAALAYIASLPVFIPKSARQKERRDLFFYNPTFVLDDNGKAYHMAKPDELREKNITPQMLDIDQYPTYPGCEGINDKDHACINQKLREHLVKKYRTPRSFKTGQVKMLVTFMVDENGEISIMKIQGGPDDFQEEVRRVFGKMPEIEPANISGIPFRTSFNLPITVNVS